MGDIEKLKIISLPDKIRKEHVNAVGDIFYGKRDYEYIRLKSRTDETHWETEVYDFCNSTWQKERFSDISECHLKEFYELLIEDFDEIVVLSDKMRSGKITAGDLCPQSDDISDSMELSKSSDRDSIKSQLDQAELLDSKMRSIQNVMRSMVESQRRSIERTRDEMSVTIKVLHRKIDNARKVLSVLEIYTGCSETIEVVRTGSYAPVDDDISIRQRILFMDEEMMVKCDEGGADYRDKNLFYEWLQDNENMKTILPEEKCVVVMKPRRYDKTYSGNYYENQAINRWNHHSFVLIRNGGNVWAIESNNLCIYDSVIPHSDKLKNLYDKLDEKNLMAEENLIDIRYRSVLFSMFIQGICERTDIFQHKPVSILKNEGVRLIFDDENLIGNGLKNWPDFLKEINSKIEHGTRVVYVEQYYPREGGDFFRSFNKNCGPDKPSTGIYNIEVVQGYKTFLYLPSTKVFHWDDPWKDATDRKRRERFIPYSDTLINYDALSFEIIERYLNDRGQRQYYQKMIPLLVRLKNERLKEENEERHFRDLLKKSLSTSCPDDMMDGIIDESIMWWKDKVIMKRRLTSDDAKAWRMIRSRVLRKIDERK